MAFKPLCQECGHWHWAHTPCIKDDEDLPPSLAAKPNIPWHQQTVEQLQAERDFWQRKMDSKDCWGAALGAAAGFRRGCMNELKKRAAQ